MAGYTRNDTGNNIADGNIINASDLDGEFDAVEAAFNASTGHTHDGTSAEGAPIEKVGPAQDLVITATEVKPKTDNTLDLGTTTLEFKDAFFDGTVKTDTLTVDENATVTGNLTVNGNTTLGNAATDTVTVTADVASDLIPSADGTYDLGASGSEWQDLYIDGTANIDSLVADTADINAGTIDGTIIGGSTPAAGSFTTFTSNGIDDNADATAITIDSDERVLIGDSNTISSPDRKLQIIGTTADNSSMSLARFSNSANSSQITFIKSRAGGNGSNGVVSDDDNLGILQFHADDGSDYDSVAALISADSDGASGSNDTPGRLVFSTTADGNSSPTERMRITNGGYVGIGTTDPQGVLETLGDLVRFVREDSDTDRTRNMFRIRHKSTGNMVDGFGASLAFEIQDTTNASEIAHVTAVRDGADNQGALVFETNSTQTEAMRIDSSQRVLIGHNANINNFPVQLTSTGSAILSLSQYSNDTSAAIMTLHKSRGSTIDSNVLSQDDDNIGIIQFKGNDGNGFHTSAQIECEHDGTTGNNDTPGRLTFLTTADGASSPTERMRINSLGQIIQGGASAYGSAYSLFLENSYSGTGQKRSIGSRYGEASGNGPTFDFFKTRSNSNAATTLVSNGDSLGEIRFYGMDGTDAEPGAVIQAKVDGTPGSNDMPGRLQFFTTADGASSGTERMRIDSSGNVGIGTSSPLALLEIEDTVSRETLGSNIHFRLGGGGGSASLSQIGLGYHGSTVPPAVIYSVPSVATGYTNANICFATRSTTGATDAPTERMRIDSSGTVQIGPSSPDGSRELRFDTGSASAVGLDSIINSYRSNADLIIKTGDVERMRIDSSGNLLIGSTNSTPVQSNIAGAFSYRPSAQLEVNGSNTQACLFGRTADGEVIAIYSAGTKEGNISVSGTTVSYNGGHLARWSRLADDSKDTSIVKGTVMSNLDAMVEWSHETTYWAEDDDLPEGVSVGDVKKEAYTEDNEQLNKMAVSSVEGDPNVAGVFVNWDEDDDWNDMNIAMTGDMVIRIAQGTTVERGDLLMSAGDGTAKPQGDDIVRSKTIAKVTSTHVSHTYDDGSYLVPCVLMAC